MRNVVAYDAASGSLPAAPAGARVVAVRFLTCPKTSLAIHLHGVVGSTPAADAKGISADSWWTVRCTGLPDRHMRLYRGAHSMEQLLRRYAFQDANGCVNHRRASLVYGAANEVRAAAPPPCVRPELGAVTGIPQFYPHSGVCWFAAMCATSFLNCQVRDIIFAHLQEADAPMRAACERCHCDRDAAEFVRKHLWKRYKVGDDVDADPRLDGRNGFAEFTVLCAKMGVPLLRYRPRSGVLVQMDPRVYSERDEKTYRLAPVDVSKPHILALRFQDGDHTRRFPVQRRLRIGDRRYRLVGVYMGQKKCGHQIGLVSPSGEWRDWVIVDADLHKDGISPIFVDFGGSAAWVDDWWRAWRDLVHVTKYGMDYSNFCNISPWNPDNRSLDVFKDADGGAEAPLPSDKNGTNSLDLIYVLCTSHDCVSKRKRSRMGG